MAKRKKHSPEEIVRKLATTDRLIAEGANGDEAGVGTNISPESPGKASVTSQTGLFTGLSTPVETNFRYSQSGPTARQNGGVSPFDSP